MGTNHVYRPTARRNGRLSVIKKKNDFFGTPPRGNVAADRGAAAQSRRAFMGRAVVCGAPRSVRAGRSARHIERHLQRGHVRTWAPSWSDATAAAVMQVLEGCSERATGSKKIKAEKVAGMLASAEPEGSRLLASPVLGSRPRAR